jgi:hypothetical protein
MNNTETVSPSIQHVAIERAIKLLNAAKAPFAIQMPDGVMVGELTVTPKVTKRKINDWVATFPGYTDAIEKMDIGDVLSWDLETEERAKAFRSSASAKGIHAFGNESCITAIKDGRHVEIMRVN